MHESNRIEYLKSGQVYKKIKYKPINYNTSLSILRKEKKKVESKNYYYYFYNLKMSRKQGNTARVSKTYNSPSRPATESDPNPTLFAT